MHFYLHKIELYLINYKTNKKYKEKNSKWNLILVSHYFYQGGRINFAHTTYKA